MKTIGLLGGMSWQSTALYYRLINEGICKRLGGLHSARIAMLSSPSGKKPTSPRLAYLDTATSAFTKTLS